jgi:phosphatidylserine decarboxylase
MDMPFLLLGLAVSLLILIPLALKWDLPLSVAVPAACLIGLFSGLVTAWLMGAWGLSLVFALFFCAFLTTLASVFLLLWRFYRDPERNPPPDESGVLAPADGKIIYIKRIEKGEVPYAEKHGRRYSLRELATGDVLPEGGYLIGTAMSFLDVHVNRAPISGKVSLLTHIRGLFLSLRKPEAVVQNERMLSVIEGAQFKIGLVQIASRLVRNIVPFCHEGNRVLRGERIGMIRFGSQVDLVLPDVPGLHVEVIVGQRVKAGETIMASLTRTKGGISDAI